MPWWGWMIAGAALLAMEMFVIDAQFYLVFLGISAALTGLFGLVVPDLAAWIYWLVFAVLALVAMFGFRERVYLLVRRRTGAVEERLTIGDRVTIPSRLEPGQSTRVEYRGSTWTARNVDQVPLEAGREARIANVDGLTLHVRAAH
jgi:membrane protein implicated in regulation of membrane protease activity